MDLTQYYKRKEKTMISFDSSRSLNLGEEVSNQLHYYASKLNFRGNTSEHNKINWVVNDIVKNRIDSELEKSRIVKFALDTNVLNFTRDDDPKYHFIDGIKKISEPEEKYPKIILKDVIKMLEDWIYYNEYDKGKIDIHARKFSVPPPDNIKGIFFFKGEHHDVVALFEENQVNLGRLCSKTRQDCNYFIVTWLEEFLQKELTSQEINYVNAIQRNIIFAKEAIEKKEEVSNLPDWDMDKYKK